jgi:hypothetical protein
MCARVRPGFRTSNARKCVRRDHLRTLRTPRFVHLIQAWGGAVASSPARQGRPIVASIARPREISLRPADAERSMSDARRTVAGSSEAIRTPSNTASTRQKPWRGAERSQGGCAPREPFAQAVGKKVRFDQARGGGFVHPASYTSRPRRGQAHFIPGTTETTY